MSVHRQSVILGTRLGEDMSSAMVILSERKSVHFVEQFHNVIPRVA